MPAETRRRTLQVIEECSSTVDHTAHPPGNRCGYANKKPEGVHLANSLRDPAPRRE